MVFEYLFENFVEDEPLLSDPLVALFHAFRNADFHRLGALQHIV